MRDARRKGGRDLAFGGGGPKAENFYEPLEAIRENGGWGIPTLKPLGGRCGEETAERGRGGASVCLCHGY